MIVIALIELFVKNGLPSMGIYNNMVNVLEDAPSKTMGCLSVFEFKLYHKRTENDSAVDAQNVQHLQVSLKGFHTHCWKTSYLNYMTFAEIIGTSHKSVYHILIQKRGMKKLRASWVPLLEL